VATTAITPTPLVTNVVSADLQDAGIVADTPADGWVIAAPVAPDTDLMLMFLGTLAVTLPSRCCKATGRRPSGRGWAT